MAWPAAVLPCFISRFLYRPLLVGVAPIALVLLQKISFSVIQVLVQPQLEGGSQLTSANVALMKLVPWVLGIVLFLSIVAAGVQYWSNERYIERQAWLDGLADRIDGLRGRAQGVVACSYCNSLHSPAGRRDATEQDLGEILGAPGGCHYDRVDGGVAGT